MKNSAAVLLVAFLLGSAALACLSTTNPDGEGQDRGDAQAPNEEITPTSLPFIAVQPGSANPDEPVFIIGEIPYTSPFFLEGTAEPFVLLEDQAGFVRRDREFQFLLNSQAIGPVEIHQDQSLTYSLALPAVPQGTFQDVDNDDQAEAGVQIFAIAYWSNIWGGPFLEKRDGSGWSTAYASTITDPARDDEVVGGTVMVWSPDGQQNFPTGFGPDGLLFTADDPVGPIPAGYNLVNLDQQPFRSYKEARPEINLIEGAAQVTDLSDLNFQEAFDVFFEKAAREYPFTADKDIDWETLYQEYSPRIAKARSEEGFYTALRDFTLEIPDAHVSLSFEPAVFNDTSGGSFGLVLAELSDGSVICTQVLPDTPAERAGIEPGAQILTWDGKAVSEAIDQVVSYFGPYSTEHHRRLDQVAFLTRVSPGTRLKVSFRNPGESEPSEATLKAEIEYDSLFVAVPIISPEALGLPVEGKLLEPSGLGYIRISSFSEDYNLMARLWEYYLRSFIEDEVKGLVIDIRNNSGGNGQLALQFAGYFFDEEIPLYRRLYYNEHTESFEATNTTARIEPGPLHYEGLLAVLVSPYCISACEGFAYALEQEERAIIVGHFPTAGAFGEVGRGQYDLPGGLSLQFPTGRPETPAGNLLIEGVGVQPDIIVPVTRESAMGLEDSVLTAAVEALLH